MRHQVRRVHEAVEIPVDGRTVRATRHEPARDGPQPVVLVYTPYHKDDLSDSRTDPLVTSLVSSGYEVVVADVLGTGTSDGVAEEPFTAEEGVTGAAVVEWLAERPWTTGSVGVIGKSYPGTTSLEIAAQDPAGLDAIVPIHAPARIYDAYFDGGVIAFLRTCGQWAPNFEYLPLQPPADHSLSGWATRWHDQLDAIRDRTPFLFQYLSHQTKDSYWATKDVWVENITVPTLAVGGYRDAFGGGTLAYADRIDAPTDVILGPWCHMMPEQGNAGRIDFLGEVESWFDAHLRNEARESRPAIRYWTELPTESDRHNGQWRSRSSWPTADEASETVTFTLGESGLSTDNSPQGTVSDTWDLDYSVGSRSIGFEIPGADALDTTPDDHRSLTYETDSFCDAFELTGSGRTTAHVVPDGTAQLVAVRVVDVGPDGTGQLVTHGVTRVGHACHNRDIDPPCEPGADVGPVSPGQRYEVPVTLRPTSHVFQPGHSLRVAVSGAFFPYVSPPDDSAEFTLESRPTTPSRCVLPGRFHDGEATFEDSCSFDPPQQMYGPSNPPHWESTHSHTDGTVSVSLSQSYSKPLPTAEFDYQMSIEAKTDRTALETEYIERETTTILRYQTETFETTVRNSVSRSSAMIQYEASRNDETVYTERKRRPIDRH